MRAVDKRRYYFSIDAYGKIMDALLDDHAGRSVQEIERIKKAVWSANFKLYVETEDILKKAESPNDFTLFPLYRGIGSDEEDFLFDSREEALREYEDRILEAVADHVFNL